MSRERTRLGPCLNLLLMYSEEKLIASLGADALKFTVVIPPTARP